MLIMFKVKNFTSFKEEAILDMRATSYKQHPNHFLETHDGTKLLKTVAIYGANASGKSNFVAAMFFFEKFIFSQLYTKNETINTETFNKEFGPRLEPFRLAEDKNKATEFDIIFTYNNKTMQYGFECMDDEIISEWYFIDNKKVFERQYNKLTFGKTYDKYIKDYTKFSKERLYLSVLEYFLADKEKVIVLSDLLNFFKKEYDVYLEIFFESSIKHIVRTVNLNDRFLEDEEYRKKIEGYLVKIDVGIKGLCIEEKVYIDEKTNKEKKHKILKTKHDVFNSDNKVCGQVDFSLEQESTGTIRFLAYIQEVVNMVEEGGVLVIDEMSSRLHPLLTKLIIDIFQDSKNTKAQLIFTTHDVSLLNNVQFRRDEVVFIDKNNRGESTLYSLSDLRVRDDATFNKDYMQGKYGAIPIFDYNDILGGE